MTISTDKTIQTYDQVAGRYRLRNQDRSPIAAYLARSVELIRARNLEHLPVLDVGCGPGFDTVSLQNLGLNAVGLDLSWNMLWEGMTHFPANYAQVDMRSLPFGSTIGAIWSCASLLHIPRQEAPVVLREFSRVLVRGGLICLSVKSGEGELWTDAPYGDGNKRFFTLWEPDSLDCLLQDSGFRIMESISKSWSGETVWLTRFAENIG